MTTAQCILLLGPPGSGKSTFVSELLYNYHMPSLKEEETIQLQKYDSKFTDKLFSRIENAFNKNANIKKMIKDRDDLLSTKISVNVTEDDEANISKILDYVENNWNSSTYNVNIDETVYKSGLINKVFHKLVAIYNNGDYNQLITDYKKLLNALLLLHIYYILIKYLDDSIAETYFNDNKTAAYNTYLRKSKTDTFKNIIASTNNLCKTLQQDIVDYNLIVNIINYFHFGMIDSTCKKTPEEFIIKNKLKILNKLEELILKQVRNKNELKEFLDYGRVTKSSRVYIYDVNKFETLYNKVINIFINQLEKDPIGYMIIQSYRFCRFSKIMRLNSVVMSINDLNDMIMDTLISNRINFTFEIVGDNLSSWHYDLIRRLYNLNYKIYAMMPVVEDDVLITRMIGRTLNSLDGNAVVLLDPVNLKYSTFKNKVNSIYTTFNDLFNMINELNIYDNRSMRYGTTYTHEFNYWQDKLFYKKNIMTCNQGMCYTIEPDRYQDVYKNIDTLKNNVLRSSHIPNILELPTVSTCHDIIITNIKYLTKRAINNKYIFNHKITYTPPNDFFTEKNLIIENNKIYEPNLFDQINKCNSRHLDKYQVLFLEFMNTTIISESVPLAYMFPNVNGIPQIDLLMTYIDSDLCNVIRYLIVEPIDVARYNNVIKKLYDSKDTCTKWSLTHIFTIVVIRELIIRKFINKYYENDNHNIILYRVISYFPEMFVNPEVTPDKLILKNADYSDYCASTMSSFSAKTVLYNTPDWYVHIGEPNSIKLLRNSVINDQNYTILFINTPIKARYLTDFTGMITLSPGFKLNTDFTTFGSKTNITTKIEGYADTSSIYKEADFIKELPTNYIIYNYQSTETSYEKNLQHLPDYIIKLYNIICSLEIKDFPDIYKLCELQITDKNSLCNFLATEWLDIIEKLRKYCYYQINSDFVNVKNISEFLLKLM